MLMLNLIVVFRQPSAQREHQKNRMVCHFVSAVFIDGADTDLAVGSSADIHTVVTGCCDRNQLALLQLL